MDVGSGSHAERCSVHIVQAVKPAFHRLRESEIRFDSVDVKIGAQRQPVRPEKGEEGAALRRRCRLRERALEGGEVGEGTVEERQRSPTRLSQAASQLLT